MAWLDALFQRMVTSGASDLHLSSAVQPMFRIDGSMVPVEGSQALEPDQMVSVMNEIVPPENKCEFEEDGDTDFAYELEGCGRFRCNYFRDRHGPGGVFRLIPSEILTAEQLALPQSILDLCHLSKGLVVVTGPTGCGKSTTLAAMIDYINKNRTDHIITIEDPIEFVHENQRCLLNQRQVGRHTESFKRALRAAMREDPDIVLVGEMRDLETVEIAIETAETGHLVFGTLHTTTAPSTVDRIIDQFSADRQSQIRTMLAGSLKGVIAQSLCKKLPKGRVAALEIMIGTPALAANIREGKVHQIPTLMQMGAKHGMRLLNDSLQELVQSDQIHPNEAYVHAANKEDIVNKLLAIGKPVDFDAMAEEAPTSAAVPAQAPSPVPTEPLDTCAPPTPVGIRHGNLPEPKAALPAESEPEPQPEAMVESKKAYEDPFEQYKRKQG